jgi:ribosomal protein S18 acetylase RimI-like enzyme
MLNWFKTLLVPQKSGATAARNAGHRVCCNGFYPATRDHADYVLESLIAEASEGHFSVNFLRPAARQGLMQQITSSIAINRCPTHRGTISHSFIYVYLQDDRPAGFSWVLAPDTQGEHEVYLFGVSREYRGRGIGKALLTRTLTQFPVGTKFTARVYDASVAMRRLLTAIGFGKSYKQTYGMVHLTYVTSDANARPLGMCTE